MARHATSNPFGEALWPLLEHARVLDAYADALLAAKEPGLATDVRTEGVRLRALPSSGASVTDLLLGFVGVADAATKALRFDAAVNAINSARDLLRGRDSPASRAGLLRAEAAIADCRGDSEKAILLSDKAWEIAPLPSGPIREPSHITVASDRIRYLRRAASATGIPSGVAARASAEADRLALALVAGGGYDNEAQLPRSFTRGLPKGRPWHSFDRGKPGSEDGGYPLLRPLRKLLEVYADRLLTEFKALKAGGHLLIEQECIHDPSPLVRPAPVNPTSRLGSWTYYTANGPWLRGRDENGCASHVAPVACQLLFEASAMRTLDGSPLARILRGGYSALSGRGFIRPHCGLTNTQLKLHVGLYTPSFVDDLGVRHPCAELTVANQTRAWGAGKVSMTFA